MFFFTTMYKCQEHSICSMNVCGMGGWINKQKSVWDAMGVRERRECYQ